MSQYSCRLVFIALIFVCPAQFSSASPIKAPKARPTGESWYARGQLALKRQDIAEAHRDLERALELAPKNAVFNNAFGILCKKDFKPKSWAELNSPDVKIAVDQGSSHDQVVSRLTPKAQISRLKSADDATAALQTGRVDAQCLITMLSLTVLKKNPSLGQFVLPTPIFATTSNAGFRRETDKTWRDYVNTWIDFNKGLGFIRNAIITNMELVGVTEADIPPGVSL